MDLKLAVKQYRCPLAFSLSSKRMGWDGTGRSVVVNQTRSVYYCPLPKSSFCKNVSCLIPQKINARDHYFDMCTSCIIFKADLL